MRSTASRNWKVQGVTFQEVYISMEDAFQALKDGLGFNDSHDTFLCVREGKLISRNTPFMEALFIETHGSLQTPPEIAALSTKNHLLPINKNGVSPS